MGLAAAELCCSLAKLQQSSRGRLAAKQQGEVSSKAAGCVEETERVV